MHEQCERNKVACHTSHDYLLVEPQQVPARKVFTPFYLLWQQLPKRLPTHHSVPYCSFPKNLPRILSNKQLDLSDTSVILDRLQGSEQTIWSRQDALQQFSKLPLLGYDELRNRPDLEGTSRLSPYLRFGLYSPRQVLERVLDTSTPGTVWEENTVRMEKKVFHHSFVSELAWREFWRHIYHYFPESRLIAFQKKRRAIRRQNNEHWFAAWQE